MKTNRILIGGLTGGVVYFFLGWLVYGILLNDYMVANLNQCASKPAQDMIWWAMILSNLATGFLLALIFSWSKTSGVKDAVKVSGILGLLMAVSIDFSYYSMTNMFKSFSVLIVDILIFAAVYMVIGAAVALAMKLGKEEE